MCGGRAMKPRRPAKRLLPAELEAAFQDPENCPIDPVVKLALSDDPQTYDPALRLLRNMAEFKRDEAAVFLVGFLVTCGDDWEKRIAIVGYLHAVETKACVDVLLGELRRVRSTNTTRPYLFEVVRTLSGMPPRLVRSKLEALAEDESLTPWVRTRIEAALDDLWERPSL
jgi:hypothetical protein